MAMINIDGVDLPAPSSYKILESDLDSSDTGRNELGVLQRDRIRQGVFKAELNFEGITSEKLATIKAATQPAQFQAKVIDETGVITKTMYASDRNIEMIKYNDDYNKIRWNISFNLVEY